MRRAQKKSYMSDFRGGVGLRGDCSEWVNVSDGNIGARVINYGNNHCIRKTIQKCLTEKDRSDFDSNSQVSFLKICEGFESFGAFLKLITLNCIVSKRFKTFKFYIN